MQPAETDRMAREVNLGKGGTSSGDVETTGIGIC